MKREEKNTQNTPENPSVRGWAKDGFLSQKKDAQKMRKQEPDSFESLLDVVPISEIRRYLRKIPAIYEMSINELNIKWRIDEVELDRLMDPRRKKEYPFSAMWLIYHVVYAKKEDPFGGKTFKVAYSLKLNRFPDCLGCFGMADMKKYPKRNQVLAEIEADAKERRTAAERLGLL